MSPALLLTALVAGLIALLPVWRLQRAGWSAGSLFTAWVLYSLGIFVGVRFPGPFRLLLPVLVLAFVAPFVAVPERLARVLGGRRPEPGVIIDVTPRPLTGLPEPRTTDDERDDEPDGRQDETPGEPADADEPGPVERGGR